MEQEKVELLAPAGSLAKLKIALLYGADAVYVGGEAFSLRVAAENFTMDELAEGIAYAHARGKKVYVTANIIPHNEDICQMEAFAAQVGALKPDGVLVSDLGAFSVFSQNAPGVPIHISTQANNVNYKTAQMWQSLGASRIVLGRELTLAEIREIHEKTSMELEVFVHGAMCMAYSGRCLLSNFMTSRDSNRGACSHPCRWNYALMEEKRPGEFFPVYENERGSFVFNSKDLCMIAHLPELIKTGVKSLKIEGRVKSEYYVATVVKAYRNALDDYYRNPQDYRFDPKYYDEVCKVSHRDYHTGFFFGRKGETDTQIYNTSSYIREYDIVGMVQSYDENTHLACIQQRNRFFSGDEIEILQPSGPLFSQKAEPIWDENMQQIDAAPHPQMRLYLKMQQPVEVNSILRMRKKDHSGKRTD